MACFHRCQLAPSKAKRNVSCPKSPDTHTHDVAPKKTYIRTKVVVPLKCTRHKDSGESDTTATSTDPERKGTAQILSLKAANFPSPSHIYTPTQPPWTMANLTPALILGRIIPLVPLSCLHSSSCQYLANTLNTGRGSNGEGHRNG